MMNGMIAVAEAVKTLGKVNSDSQVTTAGELIGLMMSYVPLTQSFSALLKTDEQTYFADSLDIGSNNPQEAAVAAAAYAKYLSDSSEMTQETGDLSTSIQNEKTQVQTEGNSMSQIYSLEAPLSGIEKMTSQLILASNF